MTRALRIGTRGSPLALAQAEAVGRQIEEQLGRACELVPISSHGDRQPHLPLHQPSEPGLFTRALEQALRDDRVDLAVHSLKDLPLAQPTGLPVVAVPSRGPAGDLLLVQESHYDSESARTNAESPNGPGVAGLPLRPGTRVGTSSPRRQAFLLAATEAVPIDLRGNVGTRLAKLAHGWVDALLMAAAPFARLDLTLPDDIKRVALDPRSWPPAPGQGALAVQARESLTAELKALDDPPTHAAVAAERAVLAGLGGGCGMPLGAHASRVGEKWRLTARLAGEEWRGEARPRLAAAELEGAEPGALAREAVTRLREGLAALEPAPPSPREPAGPGWLVAGTALTAERYAAALRGGGIAAAAWPVVAVEPLISDDDALPRGLVAAWRSARWVLLASARAVPAVARLAREHPHPELRCGAVGPATAATLRAAELPLHLLAPGGSGASLARELVRLVGSEAEPVLLPGAASPAPGAAETLAAAGITATPWPLYRTVIPKPPPEPPLASPVGVVALSPSAARAMAAARLPITRCLALGPSTAAALAAAGLACHGQAAHRSPTSLITLIKGEHDSPDD